MSSDSQNGAGQWLKGNLMSLGSVAVVAVYAAGFERTRAAAAKFSEQSEARRPAAPIRTTGEIGALTPRAAAAPPTVEAPQPAQTTPPAESHASVAASAPPAVNKTAVAGNHPDVPAPAKVVADSIQSPPPPAATPVRDSTPASAPPPSKPVEVPPAAPKPAPVAADSASEEMLRKDGTYTGWGTSRHGDIQATVQIKNGKIVFAAISECLTQYSCSWIAALPPQVLARQSADVDIVSGATQSTNAFYYAVINALTKAK